MDQQNLLARITVDTRIFGGKPIVRGRRLAVEHVSGMLAAGVLKSKVQVDVTARTEDARFPLLAGRPRGEPAHLSASQPG